MAKSSFTGEARILGLAILVACVFFGAKSYSADECIMDARESAVEWVDEWILFLKDIDTQQNVDPLINAAEEYRANLQDCN